MLGIKLFVLLPLAYRPVFGLGGQFGLFLARMRVERGRFVVAPELVADHIAAIRLFDDLGKDRFMLPSGLLSRMCGPSTLTWRPSEVPKKTERERVAFDVRLHEDGMAGVIGKAEVGLGDIDGGVHAVGQVVAHRIGMVAALGDLHAAVDGSAEDGSVDTWQMPPPNSGSVLLFLMTSSGR